MLDPIRGSEALPVVVLRPLGHALPHLPLVQVCQVLLHSTGKKIIEFFKNHFLIQYS